MSLAPPKPSPLTPGYRLDRYELLCPIAEGGMASVWVARLRGKHGFEKLVAIKTILPKYASDERFQQMFLDEGRIASGIEHTNVAQILDLGDEHDVVYLVMEWVDGDSLSKLMRATEKRKVEIPHGVMCRIMSDVCGGLHAAHELKDANGKPLGVVHRDVSPQNILISTNGVAKLIDFGIAKAKDRLAGETSAGQLKGKVQYMAPEQALGQPVDSRADIFAIGAILYHLMSGKAAYEGENQLATLHLLTSGRPPAPLPPSVPPPIAEVIKRAMSFKPEGRYDTAAEMQRALEKAMVDANIATSTVEVATFSQKHMGDRAEARRKAVDLALKAAAERARINELLRPPSSGFSESIETPSGRSPLSAKSEPSVPAEVPSPFDIPPPAESSTLGISGVMTPAPEGLEPPVKRRRTVISFVVGSAIGVATMIVVAAAITAVKRPRADHATARPALTMTAVAMPREPEPIPPPPVDPAPPATATAAASAVPTGAPAAATATWRAHATTRAPTAPKGSGKAKSPSEPDDGF